MTFTEFLLMLVEAGSWAGIIAAAALDLAILFLALRFRRKRGPNDRQ